jgi:hypothetical protein
MLQPQILNPDNPTDEHDPDCCFDNGMTAADLDDKVIFALFSHFLDFLHQFATIFCAFS